MSGGMRAGQSAGTGSDTEPLKVPERSLAISAAAEYQKWTAIKYFVIGFWIAVTVLALYPVTTAVAGKTTNVDVNLAISLTFTLAITNAGAVLWGRQQRKAAKEARDRVGKLENDLRQAKAENEVLQERADGLAADLFELRRDRNPEPRHRRGL